MELREICARMKHGVPAREHRWDYQSPTVLIPVAAYEELCPRCQLESTVPAYERVVEALRSALECIGEFLDIDGKEWKELPLRDFYEQWEEALAPFTPAEQNKNLKFCEGCRKQVEGELRSTNGYGNICQSCWEAIN